METNILKFELTATRHLDDNTLDTITASIGIPVEADDDAVNEAMNSDELIAYAVGVLYDLAAYMRPQWLDGENTGMTLETYFGDSKCQTCNGFVTMDKKGIASTSKIKLSQLGALPASACETPFCCVAAKHS